MKKVTVPEGESGHWKVERFTISKQEARWASLRDGYRAPYPGEYTRLTRNGCCIMSDTPAELSDHYMPVKYATGHILINGLGLGVVLLNCLLKDSVQKATVIDISGDVINLVSPHYKEMFGEKLEIIHADAMTWKPPKNIRYGMVWHDIWPDICGDNYDSMKRLHRRYGRFADWQGSWCRNECERLAKNNW